MNLMSEKRDKTTWCAPVLYLYEKPPKLGIFRICMVFMTLFLFCGYRGISFMKRQADAFLFYFCFYLFMFENVVHERALYLHHFCSTRSPQLLPCSPSSDLLFLIVIVTHTHINTCTLLSPFDVYVLGLTT